MTGKRRPILLFAISILVLMASPGCRNPFQAGLGDKVDIDRPVVTLDTPDLGSFLRGTVTLSGQASDDTQVTAVMLSFDGGASWDNADHYEPADKRWWYDLDTNTRPNGRLAVMVRVVDNSGKRATTQELLFTVDNEAPSIFFTFPAINPDTYDPEDLDNAPTVGKNGAIFGTVVDRDAIAFEHPKIRFWRVEDPEPAGWTSLRPSDPAQPSVYDFRYNVPTEQVGHFYVRVTVQDVGGQERTLPSLDPLGPYYYEDGGVPVGFRIVIVSGAPEIRFTAPDQADYARDTTTISGTMSHETGQQPALTLHFYERNNPVSLLTVDTVGPGGLSVTPDGTGGYTWSYELDTTALPDGTIIAQGFAQVGSTSGFDSLVFNVDNAQPTIAVADPGYLDTVYSTVTIRGTASDNSALEEVAIKVGSDDFLVLAGTYNWQHSFDSNLYGNTTHATEWDPVADLPAGETEIWRLPVVIRATDAAGNLSTLTHRLYIDQDLDKPTVNVLSPLGGSNLAGPVLVTGTAFDADPGVNRVEMQIIALTDLDDPVNPNQAIGNLTPSGDALGADAWHAADGKTQWSREINSNGRLYSVTKPGGAYAGSGLVHNGRLRLRIRAVDLGGKEGNIQELTIRLDETIPSIADVSPVSGAYVRGTFNLTATITDDEEITTVGVSDDGGTTYTTVYSGAGLGLKNYSLDYEVVTGPGGLNAVSQVRNFRIRVRDNANYTTISTVVMNIDNYWPDGELVTTTYDPMNASGAAFQVRGTAWDRDRGVADNQYPVRGIDTIEAYFEDRRSGSPSFGEFYPLGGGATTAATLEDLGNGQGPKPVVTSAAHKVAINRDHIGSVDFKAIEVDGSDSTWWARLDSTALPDGEMRVHYLLTDRAGNRTHRSDPGFVRNNPPTITSVTVGTDLNYDGSVTGGERFAYAARFNARGLVYVLPAISGGNGVPTYEIFNAADMGTPLTLVDDTIDVSAYPDGNHTFVVRVTDSVEIEVDAEVLVSIDQSDSTAPTVAIAALPLATVGHVEAVSPLNAGRPSVSGTVKLSGSAWDNQRIQEIRITVPGVGTDVLAATWVGAPSHNLVAQAAGFTVVSSVFNEAGGHSVNWTYDWNTATLPTRAAEGVAFSVSVRDFRSGPPPAVTASRTFDVVPYITGLATGLDSGTLSYLKRSAQGTYPMAYSNSAADTFRITGYNLNPAGGGVTIGASALTIEAQDGTGYSWVDVRRNSLNSGPLTVTTNGVPSINNLNDNGLAQNREPAAFYPDRADDRYIAMWGLESHTGWAGRTQAVMRPNAARTDMDWMYVSNGQVLFFNDTQLSNSWSLLGGDMGRNADGTLMYVFLHNMNWQSGTTEYRAFGSVQWGRGTAGQGHAVNWHRADTDRLGVGNLSFDADTNYTYTQAVMNRYRNLRILTDGPNTNTDNFAAYFDAAAESRSLVFWSFKAGTALDAADRVTALSGAWRSNLEKFTLGNTGANYYVTPTPANNNTGLRTPFAGIQRTNVTSGGNDSEHFDMAWDATSRILYLAYYDEATGRLRLAYNLDPEGTPGAWSTRATPIDTGAGLYVSAAVDPAGGVHLAYFDGATSNLKYAYLPSYDAPDASVVTYTVDALFTNGMHNSITIRDFDETAGTDYRPVISSFSLSYSGTRYGVRVSWPTAPIGAFGNGADPASGNYTGDWEVMAVPASTPPGSAATFVETDGTTVHQGQIVVGYNGTYIEEATLYGE